MRKWLISTALIVATLFIITSQHGGQSPQQSDPMISDKQERSGEKVLLNKMWKQRGHCMPANV